MNNLVTRYPKSASAIREELTAAEQAGRLEEVLSEIFRNHELDMAAVWNCRDFFDKISDSFYEKHHELLTIRVLVETMRGNLSRAEEYLAVLGTTPDKLEPSELTPKLFMRILSELILPSLSDEEFARRLDFIIPCLTEPVQSLALNACRPSIINGFRDFTGFCPTMEQNKDKIKSDIERLYGSSGKGIYDVALAEWKYETDKAFDALVLVAGTIPMLEDAKDIRCLFVAFMLQMRILIANGQAKASKDMFKKIRAIVEGKNYEELQASLDAAICLQSCYADDREAVDEWLEHKAPNENAEMFMMDIFPYFVKMRCYLQTGKHMMTLLLAKKFMELLKESHRPHDMCECLILSAMACYKANDEEHAFADFAKAVEIGSRHGYVRLFGDEGQLMLELIRLYRSKSATIDDNVDNWLKSVRAVAMDTARHFPEYLVSAVDEQAGLTSTEKKVLLLIAEGLSNDDIAKRLDKKTGTIKFHTAGIYRKLNVANRQQAVNAAREMGIM